MLGKDIVKSAWTLSAKANLKSTASAQFCGGGDPQIVLRTRMSLGWRVGLLPWKGGNCPQYPLMNLWCTKGGVISVGEVDERHLMDDSTQERGLTWICASLFCFDGLPVLEPYVTLTVIAHSLCSHAIVSKGLISKTNKYRLCATFQTLPFVGKRKQPINTTGRSR